MSPEHRSVTKAASGPMPGVAPARSVLRLRVAVVARLLFIILGLLACVTYGALHVMYASIGRVSESVVQQAAWTLGWIGLLTMLVGTVGFVAAIRSVTRPLKHLMADSQRVGAGDLAHRATVQGAGEVAELARSFNQMVHDLQRSRDELVRAKEYTDSVLRRMINSLIVTDAAGVIRIMNPATEDLLGYSEAELIGRPLDMVFLERSKAFGDCSWDDFLSQGAIRNVETFYHSKHGKDIPVLFSGSVMRAGDGSIQGVVCVAQDSTERRHLELLKDGFISTVSHELRTPLTTVSSGISLILDGLLGDITPEQRDFLRTVEQSTKQLTRLIETVLDVSAIESDKLPLERSEVNVEALIQEVREGYRCEAGDRRLLVCVETAPRLWLDRKRLRRVLGHLVENAIQYTQEQGTITIAARLQGASVALSVSDDGAGIPREDLGKLFGKFVQLDRDICERPGSGIGLFFCKKIIELHGGTIQVTSELGRGSSFTCLLPLPQVRPVGGSR